jgi:hypothetical protein
MTQQEQKELAEWAAEWLFGENSGYIYIEGAKFGAFPVVPNTFFYHDFAPCILAHLAKRKMEELGFEYFGIKIHGFYGYNFYSGRPKWDDMLFGDYKEHENEYIALWLAIREAVKG